MARKTVDQGTPGSSDDDLDRSVAETLRTDLAEARSALETAERRLREKEEQHALLRGELQHRVRNMLAVVRSIFSRSVATSDDLVEVADHFRGRLDVLSRYQLTRTHQPNGSADFETMVLDELQDARAGGDPRVSAEGPEVRVMHDAAQLVGLAIHELVTNSIKYGVLSSADDRAKLLISWTVSASRLDILWRESGIGTVSPVPIRKGFGRDFIEEALPYQLGAATTFEIAPGMLTCTISLPLPAWGHAAGERE